METLLELDRELLVFFNSLHTPWLDPIMMFITKTWAWIPLYIFLIYLLIKKFGKDVWIVLIAIALLIIITDGITSSIMKPYFQRLRPSRDPSLEGILHLVNGYKGGLYGFASGHAANTLGIATMIYLVLRKTYPWIWTIFIWASVMTYTRIYLGVHYPGDILVGGTIGILSGIGVYQLWKRIYTNKTGKIST
jgi:undecaprenyl-diphosphatase